MTRLSINNFPKTGFAGKIHVKSVRMESGGTDAARNGESQSALMRSIV